MLNFNEELKRFQPALEVEEIETAVYQADLSDMRDINNRTNAQRKANPNHGYDE